jgi:epoxyqueuosine reductase
MRSSLIKEAALGFGFDLAGVASADDPLLAEAVQRYSGWLDGGHGASMEYLRRHIPLKSDPSKLLQGVKSVVCVGLLYADAHQPEDDGSKALVSMYTRGRDYHELMGERLGKLAEWLGREHGARARPFVDSEPVLERFWAWRAGLGWLGKNSCILNRKLGSYLFLGGVLTDMALEPDAPQPDHCGKCRKCIDACPTGAITEGREVESAKCIAYHTIENRGEVPPEIAARTGRWIAGCDVCQQVCPWNDPITPGSSFKNDNPAYGASLAELARWTPEEFRARTKGLAMARMKHAGFARNVGIAVANAEKEAE